MMYKLAILLSSFLFIFHSNNALSETWICSHIQNGKIETNKYTRINDKEFLWENVPIKKMIYFEDTVEIDLIDKDPKGLGLGVIILEKIGKKRFHSAHIFTGGISTWEGECEIVN